MRHIYFTYFVSSFNIDPETITIPIYALYAPLILTTESAVSASTHAYGTRNLFFKQIIIIIMTIFNEETFSLKIGLQKGPRKLKIKNLH